MLIDTQRGDTPVLPRQRFRKRELFAANSAASPERISIPMAQHRVSIRVVEHL